MSDVQNQAKDIFLDALDKPRAERPAFIDGACAGDRQLRRRVEALLQAHDEPDALLDRDRIHPGLTPERHAAVDATIDLPVTELSDAQIGPYKLLQQLGEGGMGVVYMAEQSEPVKRRVALKVIKPGMDSRQVMARFEAERQALALMDHPNIAKVLDAATTGSGRPYFVMELVKGVAVTKYCDEQHLTPKERLALFIPICQAVQHAHQKGIIHRDLKPSNVLVALYDGQPVPKVIDFGVAKATSQQLTEKTMFTQIGQVVGTLEYMSPEQAQVNQLDVDTRSDIYSLGVLLYELLTGATPLDRKRLQSAAFDEMMRIIREEEPPRPSLRLSTIDTLPSVAANRRIEPKKLRTLVRGELDWIVMKALEKDRARRYETANGFAVDIQRFLNDEPVVACPPSARYRFRKFARRNKAALATATLVAIALITGMVGTTWQAIRATRAERVAEWERSVAQQEGARATSEAQRANRQLRISTVMRLASQSQAIREDLPVESALIAIEAVAAARRDSEAAMPVAHETLLTATSRIGGLPLVSHGGRIYQVPISSDGHWLVTVGGNDDDGGEVWLFDLSSSDLAGSAIALEGHTTRVWDAAISADGRSLATAGMGRTARVWDLTAADPAASPLILEGGHRRGRVEPRWSLAGDRQSRRNRSTLGPQ